MKIVELDTFYKHFPAEGVSEPSKHLGRFNIFKIEDILTPRGSKLSYSRRVFYKISLVVGHSKIHYADQCIEVEGSVLVFTNPMVPYFGSASVHSSLVSYVYLLKIFSIGSKILRIILCFRMLQMPLSL